MMQWIILLLVVFFSDLVQHSHANDLEDIQIYYDDKSHPLPPMAPSEDSGPTVSMPSFGFGPLPCSCQILICSCCVHVKIKFIQFGRRVCIKVTYLPLTLGVNIGVTFNGTSVFKMDFSARKAPNMCMPIVVPYIQTQVSFCLQLSVTAIEKKNVEICGSLNTKIMSYSVNSLHISCLRLGWNSISISRTGKDKAADIKTDKQNLEKNTNKSEKGLVKVISIEGSDKSSTEGSYKSAIEGSDRSSITIELD